MLLLKCVDNLIIPALFSIILDYSQIIPEYFQNSKIPKLIST